jgi:hypothetical protein
VDAERWAGKTIRTTIDLSQQQLLVFHQPACLALPTTVACFAYPLEEAVVPLRACFQRSHPPLWP